MGPGAIPLSCPIPVISCSLFFLVEHLEPRFLLGLVPYLAEVIQNHHFYLKMENRVIFF